MFDFLFHLFIVVYRHFADLKTLWVGAGNYVRNCCMVPGMTRPGSQDLRVSLWDLSHLPVVGKLKWQSSVIWRLDHDNIGTKIRSEQQAQWLDDIWLLGFSTRQGKLGELFIWSQHDQVWTKHNPAQKQYSDSYPKITIFLNASETDRYKFLCWLCSQIISTISDNSFVNWNSVHRVGQMMANKAVNIRGDLLNILV